jgi:hypothetical protein
MDKYGPDRAVGEPGPDGAPSGYDVGNDPTLFAFNKLRRINNLVLSVKSVLTPKTGFASQLWHSFPSVGAQNKRYMYRSGGQWTPVTSSANLT